MTVTVAPASKMDTMETMEPDEKKHSPPFNEEFGESVGLAGIKFVCGVSVQALRRTLWTLVHILGIGATVYQIAIRIQYNLNDPRVVDLDFKENTSLAFPAVTVCNLNQYRLSKTYNFSRYGNPKITPFTMMSRTVYQMVTDSYKILDDIRGSAHSDGAKLKEKLTLYEKEFKDLLAVISMKPESINNFFSDTRHRPNKEGMLNRCTWANKPCEEKWLSSNHTNLGSCLVFNPGPDLVKSNLSGPTGGLSLVLDVESNDQMRGAERTQGFKVYIHDPKVPSTLMSNIGFSVRTGVQTSIGLRQTQTVSLPKKGEDDSCTNESNMETCMLDCISDHVAKTCKCRELYMTGDAIPCNPFQFINCSFQATAYILSQGVSDGQCKCKPACKRTTFDMTYVQIPFSSHFVWQFWLSGQLFSNAETKKILKKMSMLIDWTILDTWDRSLTDTVHQIAMSIRKVYHSYFTTNDVNTIANHTNELFRQANQAQSPCKDDAKSELISVYEKFRKMFLASSFISFINDDWVVEDFQAVLASDILRNRSQFMQFITETSGHVQNISEAINSLRTCLGNTGIATPLYDLNDTYFSSDLSNTMKLYNNLTNIQQNYLLMKYIPPATEEITPSYYVDNYALLEIYYADLAVTKIQQRKADTLTSLICDIGGSLGLWIGASVLTLCEVIDVLCWYCLCKSKN